MKGDYTIQILATSLVQLLFEIWENKLFELRSERVKLPKETENTPLMGDEFDGTD